MTPASRRVALRVAYDGTRFHGSQRQPGVRTVESELIDALRAVDAIPEEPRAARFHAGSRTDAGVSAAGNVFALDTAFDPAGLAGVVNAHARDLWVTGIAIAPADFRPRASPRRAYRYHQWTGAVPDAQAFRDALALFEGEHDFSSFARVPADKDPWRLVERVRVTEDAGLLLVDVVAPSFLWNQIRRMIAAALAVARGDAALEDVARALADPVEHVRDFGLADAPPLVLVDVHHALDWRVDVGGARRARRALEARVADAVIAAGVARTLAESA